MTTLYFDSQVDRSRSHGGFVNSMAIPVGDTNKEIPKPVGRLMYNNPDSGVYISDSSGWIKVGGGGGVVTSDSNLITATTASGTTTLDTQHIIYDEDVEELGFGSDNKSIPNSGFFSGSNIYFGKRIVPVVDGTTAFIGIGFDIDAGGAGFSVSNSVAVGTNLTIGLADNVLIGTNLTMGTDKNTNIMIGAGISASTFESCVLIGETLNASADDQLKIGNTSAGIWIEGSATQLQSNKEFVLNYVLTDRSAEANVKVLAISDAGNGIGFADVAQGPETTAMTSSMVPAGASTYSDATQGSFQFNQIGDEVTFYSEGAGTSGVFTGVIWSGTVNIANSPTMQLGTVLPVAFRPLFDVHFNATILIGGVPEAAVVSISSTTGEFVYRRNGGTDFISGSTVVFLNFSLHWRIA